MQRSTYISGTSVAEENTWVPLIKRKFMAERAIHSSGVAYSIFCPPLFMDTLPKYVRSNRTFVYGRQPNPYHLVAADDYARKVAASYRLEARANKRFIIHGPEGILIHEAVKRYCDGFHPRIKKVSTMPYWLAEVISSTKGPKPLKLASDFMAAFEKIGKKGGPSGANDMLGAPIIKLEDWLRRKAGKSPDIHRMGHAGSQCIRQFKNAGRTMVKTNPIFIKNYEGYLKALEKIDLSLGIDSGYRRFELYLPGLRRFPTFC